MSMFAICGRIQGDVEFSQVGKKYTKKAVVTISETINDGFRDKDNAFDVAFLGKVAESIPNCNLDGQLVCVYGKIESHEYNGNNYVDLIGNSIQFLGEAKKTETNNHPTMNQQAVEIQKPEQPSQQMAQGEIIKDEDLPF